MTPRRLSRHRPLLALAVAAGALVAGCTTEVASSRVDDGEATSAHAGHAAATGLVAGAASPARHLGPQGNTGQFVVDCAYSHSAPADPIVHPGRPGRSHDHDFFGNTTTDAHSTLASLLDGDTTCQTRTDTAAYWSPRLLVDGTPVVPTTSTAYYRAAPGVDPEAVEAFPPGLMIVAGDMTATPDAPQSPDLAGWACGTSTRHASAPPDCPPSAPLRAVVTFPDCWDGTNLDSDDHRSHMANSADGTCPSTHPVHVPQLTFAVSYPVSGPQPSLTLASGATEGIHADFVNAWDQDALVNEVESCLHRDLVCGLSSNRGEEPLFSG